MSTSTEIDRVIEGFYCNLFEDHTPVDTGLNSTGPSAPGNKKLH